MDSLPSIAISEQLLCDIEAQLQRISVERGYLTNAGARVFRAREAIEPADLPCLVLWDAGESAEKAAGNSSSMTIRLSIVIEAHVGANLASTGRMLGAIKADVKRAVLRWAKPRTLGWAQGGGEQKPITYVGTESQPRAGAGISEVAALTFTATFTEGYGDPSQST
jgi:hypothetical protein